MNKGKPLGMYKYITKRIAEHIQDQQNFSREAQLDLCKEFKERMIRMNRATKELYAHSCYKPVNDESW